MVLTFRAVAALMIAHPEPGSRLVSRITLAPFARHWSACERCLCASPSAFTTVAEIFAFLNAAMNVGRSWVSHLTDDFVSGSRTHAWTVADCFSLFAKAPPTDRPTTSIPTASATMSFFTPLPSFCLCLCLPRGRYSVRAGRTNASRLLATTDRHLPPAPRRPRRGHTARDDLDVVGRPRSPGLIEEAVERKRRSAPHSRTGSEGGRKHLERAGASGERTLSERPAHVVDEPGRERTEAAAEDDRPDVEEVEGRGERDAEPASRVRERREGGRGAVLGAADQLVREAASAARRRRDARRAGNGLLADERLDAAAAAAGTRAARRIDRDVAELAPEPVRAPEEPAAEDD